MACNAQRQSVAIRFPLLFLVLLSAIVILSSSAKAYAAVDEQEPNDSFATANKINMNETVYGEGDEYSFKTGAESGYDYYEVNLPEAGSVVLTFTNSDF